MKKMISAIFIIFLIINGLGASALYNNIKELNFETIDSNQISELGVDYTHTVLVEVGTATWCPSCPASNAAWHNLYEEGNYKFEYCEMVIDKNPETLSRMNNYNLYWVPTSYIDGGEYVHPGTSISTFQNYLNSAGTREVWDLFAELNIKWLENSQININLSIKNNESETYSGYLRVYIIELESTIWFDYRANPYYHAFLDFPFDQAIDIPASGVYTDNTVWDGENAGYPDINEDNIQVILSVFSDDPVESYSDPPSGAPFLAYFSIETVAADFSNHPPNIPNIEGPVSGKFGENYEYTISSIDPDGDDITYCIDWGDDSGEVCIGPFNSGDELIVDHVWNVENNYTIKVKSRDIHSAESEWAILEVSMPKTKYIDSLTFIIGRLIQRFSILKFF